MPNVKWPDYFTSFPRKGYVPILIKEHELLTRLEKTVYVDELEKKGELKNLTNIEALLKLID